MAYIPPIVFSQVLASQIPPQGKMDSAVVPALSLGGTTLEQVVAMR